MKRQYKHKQSQDVVESLSNGYYINIHTNTTIPGKYIENTNDWVEITKPKYTILSFMAKYNSLPHTLREDGNYKFLHANEEDRHNRSLEYFLNPKNECNIHSVRRESDGEIFTVGDNVRLNFNVTSISKLIKKIAIEKVGVCPEKLFIYTDGEQSTINNYVKTQPKEWEITSLTSPHGPVPVIDPIGFDSLLNNLKGYTIRSIKRLSDNVEFIIGDKVDSTISDLGRPTDLTGFKVIDNKLTVGLRDLGYYPLSTIILPKKPLFTTEDGVDIYENDTCYCVSTALNIYKYQWKAYSTPAINRKWFCSKEKAEEYILMNKPCLSLNDLTYSNILFHSMSYLKNLVKTKL